MLNGDDALDTQASVRRANLRRALQLVSVSYTHLTLPTILLV